MSDETPPTDQPTNAAQEALEAAKASLSPGERLMAIGAIVILIFSYLLGEIAFDEWGMWWGGVAVMVGALGLMNHVKLRGGTVPIPYGFTLRVMGYFMGVYAGLEVFSFIDGASVEGYGIVAALAFFGGAIAMLMGARQITD